MKKILIVSDVAPPQINGVLRTLQNTNRVLTSWGHDVTMITPQDYRSISMPFYPEINLSLPPYCFAERLQGYDAVHIATEGPLGLAARLTAAKENIPFTTAYHTNFPMYLRRFWGIPENFTYKYMRWFHSKSKAVMATTPSMVNLLEQNDFKNVVHWGRGVNHDIFFRREVSDRYLGPRPYYLNVGRVSKEKNLEAFLSLDLPGTKIVIGDGPIKKQLQKQFPDAFFLGSMEGLQLSDWFNRADVFVFPSKTDTYGLVIAEAIACGIPVAAYPATGPIDVIENGVTGIINEDLKTAAIAALYLKRVAKEFSWETATQQFFDNLYFKT